MRSILAQLLVVLATVAVLLAPSRGQACEGMLSMDASCCPCDVGTDGHDLARRPPCCDMSSGDRATSSHAAVLDAPRVPDAPVAALVRDVRVVPTSPVTARLGSLGARGPPPAAIPVFKQVCAYLL